jgi:hypothetical protein
MFPVSMHSPTRETAGFAEMSRAMRSLTSVPVTDGGVPDLYDG